MIVESLLLLQLASSAGDFQFESTDLPIGTVYHYRKSNIDCSSASNVLPYIASDERIESLKWTAGEDSASWIVADMDWERFSVISMRNWRLRSDSDPELRGNLEGSRDSSSYKYEFGPN